MKYLINEAFQMSEEDKKNATSKAREDITTILKSMDFCPLTKKIRVKKDNFKILKITHNLICFLDWKHFFLANNFESNDIVFIQYPMINYPIGFSCVLKALRRKNVKIFAIIHDLNCVRYPQFKSFEKKEIKTLNSFDGLIDHNSKMKDKLVELGIKNKIIDLELFDYISNDANIKNTMPDVDVVVAGNLSKSKSGYIYKLPKETSFGLYGLNYEETNDSNVVYYGAYAPFDLPNIIHGKFGLVWDGPSDSTCQGNYGEYLKINNPHKASLYLAAGIPLIVWDNSAIANFVKKYKCGIIISSLTDIPQILHSISSSYYQEILNNTSFLSMKVRNGEFTKSAVNSLLALFEK